LLIGFAADQHRGSVQMRRTGADIMMHPSDTVLSKGFVRMALEAQLIRAHVTLQLAGQGTDGSRTATVVRRGSYEVRLVDPSQASSAGMFLFWIELFDHSRQVSIDSGGCHVLEDAVVLAELLIAQAKAHDEDPDRV
jgi:hypothetical protein